MVLNTNYWYNSNKQVDGTGDPAGEFQWMKDTLAEARLQGQKVYRHRSIVTYGMLEYAPIDIGSFYDKIA